MQKCLENRSNAANENKLMKTQLLLSFTIAALYIGSTHSANAQGSASETVKIFQALDTNGDGTLTVTEVGEKRERFFKRLVRIGDTNKDGKLSRVEFVSAANRDAPPVRRSTSRTDRSGRFGQPRRFDSRAMFLQLDRNRYGKLALSEIPQFLRRRYKPVYDRLKKTELTLVEFTAASARMIQNAGNTRGRAEAMFKRLDTNKDGKLTLKEAPESMKRIVESVLRRAGKTGSGSITKAEFLRQSTSGRKRTKQ